MRLMYSYNSPTPFFICLFPFCLYSKKSPPSHQLVWCGSDVGDVFLEQTSIRVDSAGAKQMLHICQKAGRQGERGCSWPCQQQPELVTEGAVALSASNQQSFGPEWIPVCVCMPLNAGVSIIFRSREKRTLPSLLYINY